MMIRAGQKHYSLWFYFGSIHIGLNVKNQIFGGFQMQLNFRIYGRKYHQFRKKMKARRHGNQKAAAD